MDFFTYLNVLPFRWQREINGRTEKNLDERRLTVDSLADTKNSLILSGGVKLADLTVQTQIFNLDPRTIAPQIDRPEKAIGWLQYIGEYNCLAGWFCVGPTNFETIWKIPQRPAEKWTLRMMLEPVESIERDEWLWDTAKTPFIFITEASLRSTVD